ncbi:hypothetical protein Pyn_31385 [Prunus yedoensis var. nudiflora]|uniref:Uncharacterized protein n=1 Tax=Prunus yedoensis var. nudiflora TaxID=2094558 RepID=A0A314V0Y3_PRUYE|nr:hypothetical protein Pyn_31385 [Prunus yedoensis var. nudiflora]
MQDVDLQCCSRISKHRLGYISVLHKVKFSRPQRELDTLLAMAASMSYCGPISPPLSKNTLPKLSE